MSNNTDWSQYEVKENPSSIDWSQYEVPGPSSLVGGKTMPTQQEGISKYRPRPSEIPGFDKASNLYKSFLSNNPNIQRTIKAMGMTSDPMLGILLGGPMYDVARGGAESGINSAISLGNLGVGGYNLARGTNYNIPELDLGEFSSGAPGSEAASKMGGYAADILPFLGPAAKVAKGTFNLASALKAKNITGKLKTHGAKEIEQGRRKFVDVWKDARKNKIVTEKPEINTKDIYNLMDKGERETFVRYLDKPTPKNANAVKSDFYKRYLDFKRLPKAAKNDAQMAAENEFRNASFKIKKSIEKSLEHHPDIAKKYRDANKFYEKKVTRWDIEPFRKFKQNKFGTGQGLTNEALVNKLAKSDEFKLGFPKEYPEIGRRDLIKKILISGGSAAGAGALGHSGYHGAKHFLGNFLD